MDVWEEQMIKENKYHVVRKSTLKSIKNGSREEVQTPKPER